MKFRYVDFDAEIHSSLDSWQSAEISRFAMDSSVSEEWNYYLTSPEHHVGTDTFCKVVYNATVPIAVLIIFCNPDYPVAINPIIVNPELTGKRLGTDILRDFITNIDLILPQRSGTIEVGIDLQNIKSQKMFENVGFRIVRLHPDSDFAYYSLNLPDNYKFSLT